MARRRRRSVIPDVSVMSADDWNRHQRGTTNKYGAEKIEEDNIVFDSRLEHRRYLALRDLRDMGAITDLEVHPRWTFAGQTGLHLFSYSADFMFTWADTGEIVIEDTKGGVRGTSFVHGVRMLWDRHGLMVTEVRWDSRARDWTMQPAFRLPKKLVAKTC